MKRLVVLILITALLFTITGCDENSLEKYKSAVDKTNSITKGQLSFDFEMKSDFYTEGLTNDEIKQRNYIKSIKSRTIVKYDEEKNNSIVMVYSNFGGIGFDSEIYQDKNQIFMKIPIEGKYIDLSSMVGTMDVNKDKSVDEEEIYKFISQESIEAIIDKWNSLLNEENVIEGESTILNTEDGEVKAVLFTINLTNEQINTFLKEVLDILLKDKSFINMISQFTQNSDQPITVKEMIEEVKKQVNDIEVNEFKYEVYIDIDNYIVETNLEATFNFSYSEQGDLISQKISFKSQNWDIEKEQEFEFPELTEENLLKMENIDQGIPFMFYNYFNFNEKEEN